MAVEKRKAEFGYSGSFYNYGAWQLRSTCRDGAFIPLRKGWGGDRVPEPEGPKQEVMEAIGELAKGEEWSEVLDFLMLLHRYDTQQFNRVYYKLAREVGRTKAAWIKKPLAYHVEALCRFVKHSPRRMEAAVVQRIV